MNRDRTIKFLDLYEELLRSRDDQELFYLAICHVQPGRYHLAHSLFGKSAVAMLQEPMLWKRTAPPNWLVDISVMAKGNDVHHRICNELDAFRFTPVGKSPASLYSYALASFLFSYSSDPHECVNRLLERPKNKEAYALGVTIQGLIDRNQQIFNEGLAKYLAIHGNQATRGGLRQTPEGLLCLSGMSMAFVALERSMKIEAKSDYLSIGYLEYLRSN